MIRFIIKSQRVCRISGLNYTGLSTIDADCPIIEALLTKGGTSEDGCELHQVVDAEVIEQTKEK